MYDVVKQLLTLYNLVNLRKFIQSINNINILMRKE